MPPKKKGKKKGKGGKKKGKGGDASTEGGGFGARGPQAIQAESLLQRQSLQQQIAVLKARCESLRQHNDELKLRRAKGEKDTHEFVAYFQKELEKKDDRIADYRDQLTQLNIHHTEESARVKEEFETRYSKLEEESESTIERLQMRLKIAEDELTMLHEFKEIKEIVETKLAEKESELDTARRGHELAVQQLERKFLEEKSRMKQEQERRILEIKRLAREEAQKGLDADTRKIVTDNRRMAEELRFQLRTTEELQRDKRTVEEENKKLRREVLMNSEKEQLYARKAHGQTRERRDLQAKIESLEQSLSQVVRDFERERDAAAAKVKQQLEELTLTNGGLKQLLRLKNRELKNIRQLAQVILDQRTEVEQYFLDALEQVKNEIRQRRKDEYKLAVAEYRSAMRSATKNKHVKFPSIRAPSQMDPSASGVSGARLSVEGSSAGSAVAGGPSSLASALRAPGDPNMRVDLRDLSWEDRERVLRLLFAKINNVQSQVEALNAQQAHSLDEPSGAGVAGGPYPPMYHDGGGAGGLGAAIMAEGGTVALKGQSIALDEIQPQGYGAMQYSRNPSRNGSAAPSTRGGAGSRPETGPDVGTFAVTGVGAQPDLV